MNIGILGTGTMAGGLGSLFARAGHAVCFGSRDPERARQKAAAMGFGATGGSTAQAAAFGELLVLSVPGMAAGDLLSALGPLDGKVILDHTNPLDEAWDLALGYTTSGAEEIVRSAPGARVVKAFNTVFATNLRPQPEFNGHKPTVFYCGDDADAKSMVAGLIEEVGFEAVDAGPLTSARYLEPVTGLLIQLGYKLGMGTDIVLKLMRR